MTPETIQLMIRELKEQGYGQFAKNLDDALYGATGSEILFAVRQYMKEIQDEVSIAQSTRLKAKQILKETKKWI